MVVYYHALDWEGNGTKLAQNKMQTLTGGQLRTAPAFVNFLAGQRCCVNKSTVRLTLG